MRDIADKMLGKKYISPNTDEEGYIVQCVYIQEELDVEMQLYLRITLDRKT